MASRFVARMRPLVAGIARGQEGLVVERPEPLPCARCR